MFCSVKQNKVARPTGDSKPQALTYEMRVIALVCLAALVLCATAIHIEWQDCSLEGEGKVKSVTLTARKPYLPRDSFFKIEAELGALVACARSQVSLFEAHASAQAFILTVSQNSCYRQSGTGQLCTCDA